MLTNENVNNKSIMLCLFLALAIKSEAQASCPCKKSFLNMDADDCQDTLKCYSKNLVECDKDVEHRIFKKRLNSTKCEMYIICSYEYDENFFIEAAAKNGMTEAEIRTLLVRNREAAIIILDEPQCSKELDKMTKIAICENGTYYKNCMRTVFEKPECYIAKVKNFAQECKKYNITIELDDMGNGKKSGDFGLNYFVGIIIALLMI